MPLLVYEDFPRMEECCGTLSAVLEECGYDGYFVAWRQAFGWTTEGIKSKISNTAEQHSAANVAEIIGAELVADLGHIGIFKGDYS